MASAKTDPGLVPVVAAVALFLAGGAHLLLAVQFFAFWWLDSGEFWATTAIGVSGASAMVVATQLWQGRSWAAKVGTALAPLLGVMSTAFAGYWMVHLSFALYMFVAPPTALLAVVLAPFAIGPCVRAERALAELLAKQGDGRMFRSLG
jgi:hypothetical protein